MRTRVGTRNREEVIRKEKRNERLDKVFFQNLHTNRVISVRHINWFCVAFAFVRCALNNLQSGICTMCICINPPVVSCQILLWPRYKDNQFYEQNWTVAMKDYDFTETTYKFIIKEKNRSFYAPITKWWHIFHHFQYYFK